MDVDKVLGHPDLTNETWPMGRDLDDIVGKDNIANPTSFSHTVLKAFLIKAKWFTRGWTLQELLAPPYLVFVDRTWRRIGTRESWADEIEKASRIEARYLTSFNPTDFTSCSIAMRLSWASRRQTTVEEDETYSLLGLFGVSLPLIYGEGRLRAFNRLRRELVTVHNDDSIFAWKVLQPSLGKHVPRAHQKGYNSGGGVLAPSIREFWDAFSVKSFGFCGNSFSMTNRSLEITAKRWRSKADPERCLIRLNCGVEPSRHIGIPLIHFNDSYERIHTEELYDMRSMNYDDWAEERGSQSTFIQASSNSNFLIPSSIFSLQYPPERVSLGDKYLLDYSVDIVGPNIQRLAASFSGYDLKKDELVIEPSQLVFINISMQCEGSESELDIVINLTNNGFPSAGILERGKERWERLGDPMTQASGMYEALADHLHAKIPPVYPLVALEETDSVISIFLLPRPPLQRSFKLPPETAKSVTPREYVLKISVGKAGDLDQDTPEHQNKKRKRS